MRPGRYIPNGMYPFVFVLALVVFVSLQMGGVTGRVSRQNNLQVLGTGIKSGTPGTTRNIHSKVASSGFSAHLNIPNGRPDDMLERLTSVDKEKMFADLRQKLTCAQSALIDLKEGVDSIVSEGQSKRQKFARKNLHSSMDLEAGLREHWYPIEFVKQMSPGASRKISLFDMEYTLSNTEAGLRCISDSGSALEVFEKDGFLWVYPGDKTPPEIPSNTRPPKGYEIHAELEMEVPVEHGLLMENLLDLAHAPFTHTSTFAKGWPVPDSVKFHANKMLSGSWDPYPIDMAFDIPCMVNSKIGLIQVGKAARNVRAEQCDNHLHQLHVCIPR